MYTIKSLKLCPNQCIFPVTCRDTTHVPKTTISRIAGTIFPSCPISAQLPSAFKLHSNLYRQSVTPSSAVGIAIVEFAAPGYLITPPAPFGEST